MAPGSEPLLSQMGDSPGTTRPCVPAASGASASAFGDRFRQDSAPVPGAALAADCKSLIRKLNIDLASALP